ncbi:fimbrillin family protein, partial [Segatella albensis]|uniref:fimbrillin family protein n=1 Tax=Segatella albensis TaxID=77768 RepID=UPI0013777A8C
MKKLNQKYIGLGLMTMATVLGLGSCADSVNSVVPNIPLTNKNIGYDVSVNSDINYVPTEAEAKTRAASMANDGFQTPHVLQGYGKTLYLHPLVQTMQTDPNAKNVATRGTQINDVNDMSDFGVLGKYYSDGELSTTSTNYFYNIRTTKVGAMTESRAWPISTYNLAVYAYHPYNAGEVSLSAADAVGAPVVTYTVNSANPNTMSDFMTASATGKKVTDGNSIPLTFNHNLAAINFVVGADMTPGTIKSVTFKGIYNTGDFTIGGNWSFAGKETSDITFSGLDVAIDGDENDPIITSARTFFMIPQSFDAQAQAIEIVFNDGESDHTLTTTLAGTNWQAGKTITYKISASAITTLNLGSISFASAYDYNVLPKSTWANGDMVGLYVKDQKGVLRNENVKLTYNSTSGKWDVDQSTVGANSLLYSPQYDYYVYYPYSASGLANEGNTNAKTRASMVAGSANTFFAAGIAAFNPSTNQSSNISSSDLQTAKGLISTVDASSINFTMAHEMALYKVTLGSKTIPVTHIYDVNANSWSNSTDTKSVKALNNFAGGTITGLYRPNNTGDDYYALVNPTKAYTFRSASGQPNGWYNNALSVAASSLTRGGVGSGTAQSDSAYIYTAYAYSYTGSVQAFTAPL